jgi:hypothetical protein
VTFYDGPPGASGTVQIGQATLNASDFNQNFGQATKTVPWNVPNSEGVHFVFVTVDSTNLFREDNENDNTAGRRIRIRQVPPDRTPPTVSNVKINNDAAVTNSPDVTVSFDAVDPPSPGGQTTSELDSFCIVRYSYDTVRRRWVEEECNFRQLPTPNGNTFSVNAQLRPREGTAYAFVWVKDKAGNISRVPGFDVISFIPSPTTDINMDRNDVRTFRITLNPGQSFSFTATPSIGDVDLSVFQGATRIAVSAQNGTTAETVSFSNTSGTQQLYQIEARAVVNSRFRITIAQTLAGLLNASPQSIGPSKLVPNEPLVSGPPALQAAIEGGQDVMVPVLIR